MANVALVDSNVFIGLARRRVDPLQWLPDKLQDIYTCGMVRLEVLRGIRDRRQHDKVEGFFNVLCNVPTNDRVWEAAAQLGWELDRRGKVIPAQDILIASCALRAGVPVMTADGHFQDIPDLAVIDFADP